MAIINQLKHSLEVTKFKTDQFMRINRVQSEIGALHAQIKALKEQIADAVVDLHKENYSLPDKLENLCENIDQFEINISAKEAEIAFIRAELPPQTPGDEAMQLPVNPCTHCHKNNPEGASFCVHCGKPISNVEGDQL